MDEAIARGQLSPEDSSSHSRKRRKLDDPVQTKGRDYERNSGGNPARRSIPNARGKGDRNERKTSPEARQPSPISKNPTDPSGPSPESDEDDDKPEVISSKQKPLIVKEPPRPKYQPNVNSGASGDSRPIQKRHIPRPRREPPNPFASRPALLRNVRSTSCILIFISTFSLAVTA